ncbi:hypothetical protein BS78_03G266200 [Paspalum vaginatum]|nr:hypothetical protein BS78_03G266200 [Paspalum vaginatum]
MRSGVLDIVGAPYETANRYYCATTLSHKDIIPRLCVRPQRPYRRTIHRCFPKKLADVPLVAEQEPYVEKIGCGPLLNSMPFRNVNCYDPTLWLGAKINPIRPLAPKLLGLPEGKLEMPSKMASFDDVEKKLMSLTGEENKDKFCVSYMLLALGHHLALNTTICVARRFFGVLEDISRIKEYKWCTFVADNLIKSIIQFTTTTTEYECGFTEKYATGIDISGIFNF